ncbi:glycosyltransferase family 2 protein [Plantibacter sp. YIM 135249]|jgi:glycosyltransferase involved in cell wall biosynthesis|uniref:glycosyltransferase family 2 protein n=1 Tax=Plantibacter sp. YIM 135249 TaxID=3423918 RepID=UPI003D345D62
MTAPLLSVVIPSYNAASTIDAAIASAAINDATEIIVVDDGSTDDSAERAASAGASVIRQANSGASAARTNGLASARGQFVVFLDSDDEVIGDGIRRSLDVLRADPTLAVSAGRVIGLMPDGSERLLPTSYKEVSTEALLTQGFGPWPPAAAVIRRSALDAAQSLEPAELRPRFAEDYELMIRLSMVGRLEQHDVPSARYRLFAGKSSTSTLAALTDKERLRTHYAIALGIAIEPMSEAAILAASRMRSSRVAAAHGNRVQAALLVLSAFTASPSSMLAKLRGRRTQSRVSNA